MSDFGAASGGFAGASGSGTGGTSVGGSGGVGGAGGIGGSGGSTIKPIHLDASGSFDFRFETVTTQVSMGPSGNESATHDRAFRVDLVAKGAGDWFAYITPRWGFTSEFSGTIDGGSLVLTGTLQLTGIHNAADGSTGELTDTWQSIVLGLNDDGTLDGTVSASGQVFIESAGEGWSGTLQGSGSLNVDSTAPEAAILGPDPTAALNVGNLPFMGSKLLPWEPVLVRFAEPVSFEQARSHSSVLDANDATLPVTWMVHPKQNVAADGVILLAGVPTSWAVSELPWNASVTAGYTDGTKLTGDAANASGVYLGLPTNEASTELFSAPSDLDHFWGVTSLVAPEAGVGICEDGGCVQIGPVPNVDCGADPSGIALRLAVPSGATVVKVRYRLLVEGVAGVAPTLGGIAPLSIQVARQGQIPIRESVVATDVTDLGTQQSGYRFGTAWTTREVVLPEGSGDVGVAIRTGGSLADRTCLGGQDPTTAVNVELFVDSISVE